MQKFHQKDTQALKKLLKVKKWPGKYEIELWKKVARFTPLFAKIPGILCVCVCNSLAMNAVHKNSDIDLFIITKKNRLWTVRILITLLLFIKGERKTAKHHAWKFCLSFFITENAFDFENISIKNDIYLSYWMEHLTPIINRRGSYEAFLYENWLKTEKKFSLNDAIKIQSPKIYTLFWDIFETWVKSIFLPRTKKSFQKLWKPFWVIITDDMLKFHDQDRRKEIRDFIFS